MDEGLPSVSILLLFVVILIDVFIHGFGVALLHIKEDEIEKKSEEGKDSISKGLLALLSDDSMHIKSMQFVTILLNMLLGAFSAGKFTEFFGRLLGYGVGEAPYILLTVLVWFVLILVVMIFGVLIPRRLALRKPEPWAYVCFYPVKILRLVVYPVVWIIDVISNTLLYLVGVRDDDTPSDVTEEEIKSMVSEGQEQGVLQEAEADMISNIFEFSDKEAQDIMTNRNAMVAIDANMTLKEAVDFMMNTNNSRFPVYLDDIDHIIGIMHIRDAMKKLSLKTDEELPIRKIKGLLRHPKFVPETRNIDSLFHSMQSSKTQMVIVIDEYGQTAGLVSMEDILEEIVGSILDEYDEDENFIKSTKNPMEYTVDGMTPIEILEKKFDISFEESEFETLNGYLISKLDRIPEEDVDFTTTVSGYSFKILSVKNHMIESVLMTKLPEEETEDKDNELEIAK
ncbi:hemolysin family protein [Butyrivibrio proteoclasticus]|uniref:hemolysin family protein n=1 Tax=Butyrivibrio proteoclasticus TaxID=43305 RepID=UPI000479351B|nr:hemolysin family protein [Butyrivibrio proteoclasticus]